MCDDGRQFPAVVTGEAARNIYPAFDPAFDKPRLAQKFLIDTVFHHYYSNTRSTSDACSGMVLMDKREPACYKWGSRPARTKMARCYTTLSMPQG